MPLAPSRPAPLGFKPPSRAAEPAGTAGFVRRPESVRDVDEKRRLVVGREISFSGDITTCDHLVVEGRVDATLSDARSIEVSEGGLFKGTATVDSALIGGHFDGKIVVRGRLSMTSTGLITGTVVYGELEIEAGGRIEGSLKQGSPDELAPAPVAASQPKGALSFSGEESKS
jgi:cytoskeletal protein CcmA (bactofilin family)